MRINFVQSCVRKLHKESQCAGQPADWRKGATAWQGLSAMWHSTCIANAELCACLA